MTSPTPSVLDIQNLHVRFDTAEGVVHAVRGIDCYVQAGECLGVVGESGSGKSQTFLAAMGLLSRNASTSGNVLHDGHNLLQLGLSELNRIRGMGIGMIFQDPLTALTPHLKVGDQLRETLDAHLSLSRSETRKRCLQWLERVHMPDPDRRLNQYPHELSGGMRQRVMIAMAMICEPALLIADEPTTALDVTIQAEILDLIQELQQTRGTAVVLITHDMGVVARLCDRVQVMRNGAYVESGPIDAVFHSPENAYTRQLLDAVPRIELSQEGDVERAELRTRESGAEGLSVEDVAVSFPIHNGTFKANGEFKAVNGISFELAPGETLGVVGESGSGKSTLARAVLQLIQPTGGRVSWLGTELQSLSPKELRQVRRDLQIVFQDPFASLDPAMSVGESIAEPLRVFEPLLSRKARRIKVRVAMERVGLEPLFINRYPHELSGGQNQRVGIARAIIAGPKLLICDEAVSALDVSIQAQIIELLGDLQQEMGLAILFISHDLSVVWQISHRILVMYLGTVVELAETQELFDNPCHPYTRQLISAVPIPDPRVERQRQRIRLKGSTVSPMAPGARLRFLPSRLGQGADDAIPDLMECSPGHLVAEHDPLESLLVDS